MNKLSECVNILDHKRVPLSFAERENLKKIYPYYGAQGIIDYVDDYLFDGEYILVAEDGNNLKSLNENIATWTHGKFWVNNHAHILGKKKGYNLRYIYYLINSMDLRGYITGSAQPKLNQENLRNIELELPDEDVQNKVAYVLSIIDDKIENNIRTNVELESMAKCVYEYWFLQFDFPDENGKPYKTSGGKMVWNEELKQEIPEGWEVKRLGKIFDFIKGKIPEELNVVQSTDTLEYLTIDAVNGGDVQYCRRNNMIITSGEVIMVMDGAASSEVYVGNYGVLGSTFCKLVVKNSYLENNFLYVILKEIEGILKKVNTGSTVPHANKKYISDYQICMPSDLGERKQLQKQINNIIDKVIANRKENKELASLRDFLLPLFMSGQVVFGGK